MITVMVYMPNCPPIWVRSSISTIFPAIRKSIPIGAYLIGQNTVMRNLRVIMMNLSLNYTALPHDDSNEAHDCFIEAVKEVPQDLALLLHVANY